MNDQKPYLLQEFLRDQDTPCPSCSYNLRDLTGSRCPECGEALALQVGALDPRIAASIAGLIGLAAGTGLNGLLVLYWAIQTIFMSNFGGGDGRFLTVDISGLVVVVSAMALWLKHWRKVRRLPRNRRWLLVGGCWLLTIADLILFSIFVK